MSVIGYEYVRQALGLSALVPSRPARVMPVTRVERMGDRLAVPGKVAPVTDQPLAHLLFALKHEGTRLDLLLEAFRQIPAGDVLAELQRTPSGGYARLAGYLWEQANRASLDDAPAAAGVSVDVFDPKRYVTGPAQRDARWRVNFNGLGSIRYSASVERTPLIEAALAADILGRANRYAAGLDQMLRDRALAWAYLHETRDSFAIERESPSEGRARAFVALLHQAHERFPLSEDYLVQLQQATVSNPLDRAMAFRHEQNWLQGPLRGAAGVSYVPPAPDIVDDLMGELMAFANSADGIDPLVLAAVVSFGFVFIHPFMDGNGRLSRFLYHHALCRAGALQDGLILPVSVAMKKHEREYLQALQSFSKPARERWQVHWIDEGQYDFQWQGDADWTLYRHWDATACVEFTCRMAEQALDIELRQETEYLARYDAVLRRVSDEIDVRGSDLSTLVTAALGNGGLVSKRRRDQFALRVPASTFGLIEQAIRSLDSTDESLD